VDFRYQRAADPVNRECLILNGHPLSWENIYKEWRSTEHQYYWRHFDLNLVPFDRKWHDQRDAMAFELAAEGDGRAISALQRIVSTDPDESKRERAALLLDRIGKVSHRPGARIGGET
jgi:hypothetical protein